MRLCALVELWSMQLFLTHAICQMLCGIALHVLAVSYYEPYGYLCYPHVTPGT